MTLLPLFRRTSLYNKPWFIQPILPNRPTRFFQFLCCHNLCSLLLSPVSDYFLRMNVDKALALEINANRAWLSDSLCYEACCPSFLPHTLSLNRKKAPEAAASCLIELTLPSVKAVFLLTTPPLLPDRWFDTMGTRWHLIDIKLELIDYCPVQ